MLCVDVGDEKILGAKSEGAVAPLAAEREKTGERWEVKALREGLLLLVVVRLLRECGREVVVGEEGGGSVERRKDEGVRRRREMGVLCDVLVRSMLRGSPAAGVLLDLG
jgi:hypothetical protein